MSGQAFGIQGRGFNDTGEILATSVIIVGKTKSGLFVYLGTASLGNGPIDWVTNPTVTQDPKGNILPVTGGGFVSVAAPAGGLFTQLTSGLIQFGDTLSAEPLTSLGQIVLIHSATTTADPVLAINSPAADSNDTISTIWLLGQSETGGLAHSEVAMFGESSGGPNPLDLVVCGTIRPGIISGGLPTPFGPTVSANANSILVTPTDIPAGTSGAALEVQPGSIGLLNGAVPSQQATYAIPFSKNSDLHVLSGTDGNTYSTEVWHVELPAALIDTVTPISTNIGPAINVGVGRYKFHISGIVNSAVAAGIARVLFSTGGGAVISASWMITKCTPVNGAPSFDGVTPNALGPLQIANPLAASNYTFESWGELTLTTGGDIQFQGNTSNAADGWGWTVGALELYPVN